MNIETALAQLADPKVSGEKKRKLMDQLNEQTTQKQQDPLMNAILSLGAGGLASLAGGAGARKIAQNAIKNNKYGPVSDYLDNQSNFQLSALAYAPLVPKDLQRSAKRLGDAKLRGENARFNLQSGKHTDTVDLNAPYGQQLKEGAPLTDAEIRRAKKRVAVGDQASLDASTAAGAALGGGVGFIVPGLAGNLTMKETVPQPPEARAALDRIAAGTATAEDVARFKQYHEGASNTGGFIPSAASWIAGAALGIPTAYIGGPAAGRLARKYKAPIAGTASGRHVIGESAFDSLVGGGLGGAGASMAYNALSNPYEEPF